MMYVTYTVVYSALKCSVPNLCSAPSELHHHAEHKIARAEQIVPKLGFLHYLGAEHKIARAEHTFGAEQIVPKLGFLHYLGELSKSWKCFQAKITN